MLHVLTGLEVVTKRVDARPINDFGWSEVERFDVVTIAKAVQDQ